MKINREKMERYGYSFENLEDVYFYAYHCVDYLQSHNKNYTKEQYNRIIALKDIFEFLEG